MIEAEVYDGENVLVMSRAYYEPSLTLEDVLSKLEAYVTEELLNTSGEILVRARYKKGVAA